MVDTVEPKQDAAWDRAWSLHPVETGKLLTGLMNTSMLDSEGSFGFGLMVQEPFRTVIELSGQTLVKLEVDSRR